MLTVSSQLSYAIVTRCIDLLVTHLKPCETVPRLLCFTTRTRFKIRIINLNTKLDSKQLKLVF